MKAVQPTAIEPRLLTLQQAAQYIGLSYWSTRDLVLSGDLPSVRMPCPRAHDGRNMRRILVDRQDLDTFIESHKERELNS